jgi:hypothetical protein
MMPDSMLRGLVVLVAVMAMANSAIAQQVQWVLSERDILQLESAAPKEDWGQQSHYTPPLSMERYTRYYAENIVGGHHIIEGEFVASPELDGGIHILSSKDRLPLIMDGGCNIVRFTYDLDASKFTYIRCNGVG